MRILEGSPVSPGFAKGIAIVCDYQVERKVTLPGRDILNDDVQSECDRIDDLTQYMLAADRDLSEGTDDCTAMHPAVLRAIKRVVQSSQRWNCPVCVCGEEAGESDFACLLVGLGVRELSLSPSRGAAVRHAIRRIDSCRASELAERALQCRSPSEVRELLTLGRSECATAFVSQETSHDLSSYCS